MLKNQECKVKYVDLEPEYKIKLGEFMKNKIGNWIEYPSIIKARRIIYNPACNDWNDEPEYKLQKVRIYGETKSNKSYVIDSYGSRKFACNKNEVFLNQKDFEEKIDKLTRYNLTENQKQYLLKQFC